MRPCLMTAVLAAFCATSAAATAIETKLDCADRKGWTIAAETVTEAEGRDVVTIRMSSPVETQPPVFAVRFEVSGAEIQHVWKSDYRADAYHLWPLAWPGSSRISSQLAENTPIAVAFDGDERAHLAVACSEAFEKVEFALAEREDTCVIPGYFRFFTEPVLPRKSYEVKILFDRRVRFWADAVRDASDWIVRTAGFVPADVPAAAFEPLYSTWYAYWQDVHAAPLEREARLAAELGMKVMILDDGWQKQESASFYSATGDWMPVASRFPDMKAHVAAVHAAGLKYMLWLSVPYVGDESKAWERFKDKMLTVDGARSPGRVGILDPRYPDVREYLIETYERAVGEWGFDGLKLDFIDQFVLRRDDPAKKRGYAGCDIRSVPAAVDRLMKDILARLKRINPDVLLEFRQRYMGPAIRQYGNMIRAADCPADPWSNRKRICDLRLTSGSTAVHADMIAWSRDETPEGAALPILNALFSTIQYSMVLDRARADHKEMVRHWIRFTAEHRDTLLRGSFRPRHPQANYPLIEAEGAAERIIAVYNRDAVVPVGNTGKPVVVVNATKATTLVLEGADGAAWASVDTFGRPVATGRVPSGLARVEVPASGCLRLSRDE